MKTATLIGALAAAGLLALNALSATAAGLGRINVLSSLDNRCTLRLNWWPCRREKSTRSARARPDAFRDAKIEYSHSVQQRAYQLEKRANGQPYLRLVSTQSVDEPFSICWWS
jgi:Tfp pilus assembly protein FimV